MRHEWNWPALVMGIVCLVALLLPHTLHYHLTHGATTALIAGVVIGFLGAL